MSSRKFRFVSPGVFLREVDNSQLPAQNTAVGPVIIGTANQGPAMVPTKIKSLEELEIVFGKTSPGGSLDPWREGTGLLSETHAMNAARAYLSAGAGTNSPVTIIRLLGIAGDDADTTSANGEPGWTTDKAYGLFLANKDNTLDGNTVADVQLAGVFYSSGSFEPKAYGENVNTGASVISANATTGQFYQFASKKLKLALTTKADNVASGDPAGARTRTVEAPFADLRKDLNTNPVATNSRISPMVSGTLSERYWLGESFEQEHARLLEKIEDGTSDNMVYAILPLDSGAGNMSDFKSKAHGATPGRTGWIFGNASSEAPASYNPDNQQKLFRLVSLHEGQQGSKEMIASIQDVVPPRAGSTNVFSSFSVVVKRITSTKVIEIERFTNCNLNPQSANFVAKKIGDQTREWRPEEKRNRLYGEHPNASSYVRVEMHSSFPSDGPLVKSTVPFGFYGPIRPKTITAQTPTAVAAVAGTATLMLDTGDLGVLNLVLTNTDGSTVTLTAAALGGGNPSTATQINTDLVSHADGATVQLKASLDAAVLAGTLKMTVSAITNNSAGAPRVITLTQTTAGIAGNKAITGTLISGNKIIVNNTTAGGAHGTETFLTGADATVNTNINVGALNKWVTGNVNFTGMVHASLNNTYNIRWPSPPLVEKAHSGRGNFLGISAYTQVFDKVGGVTSGEDKTSIFDGFVDNYRRLPAWQSIHDDQISGNASSDSEYSFKFSLDDVILRPIAGVTQSAITSKSQVSQVEYVSGSRILDQQVDADPLVYRGSFTAQAGSTPEDLRILFSVVDGFHIPFDGGSDGTNIIESDPFNEKQLETNLTKTSYAYASVDRAIELIKDPESIEHNLAVMPGITNRTLARKLVDTCEARADSMAIIDLPDVYIPPSQQHYSTFKARLATTPEASAKNLVSEQLNSSYGATYYPWVKIKDTSNGRDVWAPPSVVALGVMANTEKSAEVWFAPAGFNRGGLNQGNAGLPVIQVTEQLLSRDRDTLYQANINPIASFVSEGIVIFGQKTLQSTQSALDRINVRRLLIFVKKEVSKISKNLLFEQNVQATWTRFHGQIKPFLESVKVRFGLTDFKIVLDETTTTPDLIDRNIMYAKIFLKPARSIEFIAVDFVITNTGASFADPLE